MSARRRILTTVIPLSLLAACSRTPDPDPRMVSEWMHTLYGVIRSERIGPPVASRMMAYVAVALHEGMAAATPGMPLLAGVMNGLETVPAAPADRHDPALVAIEAERAVLDSFLVNALPSTRAVVGGLADSLVAARRAQGIDAAVVERSLALGRRIGVAVYAASRTDGFAGTRGRPYAPPAGPGLWYNDAPGALFAVQSISGVTDFIGLDNPANTLRPGAASDRGMVLDRPKGWDPSLPALNIAGMTEPYWMEVRPFLLRSWDECPIEDPPPYATDTASAFHRDARAVYDVSRSLTPEQRTIALYWADNPGETGTPSGHWLAIASQMISQRRLDAVAAARIYAAVALSQADAFIASWGYKYRYNLIRPRAYIRDHIDPSWEPLIGTPPFPEYPSGHSTQSRAAAETLIGLIGDGAFDDSTSIAIGHEVRRFASFREASDEAGVSRIYGGIHFHFGNVGGQQLGTCIGERILARFPPVTR